MEIPCLDGQRHTYLSIAFPRTESLHSTLHRSHWTLSANNPTCCSHPIITSLLLDNTVKRLNGLLKSAVVIWSIRSADILDAHGDHTSTIRLLLIFSPDAAVSYFHCALSLAAQCIVIGPVCDSGVCNRRAGGVRTLVQPARTQCLRL